jgi:hypothetical protein
MHAYIAAKQIFNLTHSSVYAPHISLMYGDNSFEEKQHITETLIFIPQQYTVSSLIITPGGEHPPSEWKHLADISLNQG